jgi:hypothetical protein
MGDPVIPMHMTTPRTAQTVIFTIIAVVLAGLLIASLFQWRRSGRATMTLLILGGFVCCLNESTADVLGHCYFPTDGWMGQTLVGRTIPLWVDLTYAVFFGAFPWFLSLLLRRGTSRRAMWSAIGTFWVLNVILELPLLGTKLYVYYGEQPFKVAHFPLFWLTINVLGAFSTAVVVARFGEFFRGRRALLLLVLPFATYMASWVVDMPGFWALNSHASTAVKWVGVGASMVLGVIAIDALIRFGRAGARAATPDAEELPPVARPTPELQTV